MTKGLDMAQGGHCRRRALFTGNVQGVGFRFRTVNVAQRFSVTGFVRNLSDGRVELAAEGGAEELDRFLAAVRAEMRDYIDDVQVETSPGTGEWSEFQIRM